jgi:hypothetical protein
VFHGGVTCVWFCMSDIPEDACSVSRRIILSLDGDLAL